MHVTPHARDRLGVHYHDIGTPEVLQILERAEEVDSAMVAPLLGRSLEGVRDRYFLADDRRGVLVVVRSHPSVHLPWTLVTYLRFGPAQRAFAVRIWGER